MAYNTKCEQLSMGRGSADDKSDHMIGRISTSLVYRVPPRVYHNIERFTKIEYQHLLQSKNG